MTEALSSEQRKPFDRHKAITRILDNMAELTEPRHISELVWIEATRKTERHTHTLPALIEALRTAVSPGADTGQASGGKSFESRPAARLEPIKVLADIDREARALAGELDIQRATLIGYLRALNGAASSLPDTGVRRLDKAAHAWRRNARLATGEDAPPMTLNQRCPNCWERNCLVVYGDHADCTVRCGKCGTLWEHDMVGLLGEMIQYNEQQETMTDTP